MRFGFAQNRLATRWLVLALRTRPPSTNTWALTTSSTSWHQGSRNDREESSMRVWHLPSNTWRLPPVFHGAHALFVPLPIGCARGCVFDAACWDARHSFQMLRGDAEKCILLTHGVRSQAKGWLIWVASVSEIQRSPGEICAVLPEPAAWAVQGLVCRQGCA